LFIGGKAMRLTLFVYGAFSKEISCPELRVAVFSDGQEVAEGDIERFFVAMHEKCRAIIAAGESYPLQGLVPYAKLFWNNQETVRRNLSKQNEVLVEVV